MNYLEKGNVVSLEDRIPKLKQRRRKKANRRAVILLSLFFLLLILVLYFLSPISHVKQVTVKGNQYLSDEILVETSNISTGMNIWKLDKKQIVHDLESIKEINNVSISIKFPNTVQITVGEHERLAYVLKESEFYPILANGESLEAIDQHKFPINAPLLIGFEEGKELEVILGALEELPEEISNAISEIHYDPTETDKFHVRIFMNDGYEIVASSRTLAEKIIHYPSIVSQLDPDVKGVIDLEVGTYFRKYD